eukprot:scaffold13998_cov173-Skeletonema_marinoi.AAC.2
MEKIVSSSKEDGASADAGAEAVDEDAVDMEENDVTIGGMEGKMLRNVVLNHFPLHDIRSTCGERRHWMLLHLQTITLQQ